MEEICINSFVFRIHDSHMGLLMIEIQSQLERHQPTCFVGIFSNQNR